MSVVYDTNASGAWISDDLLYRYALWRCWEPGAAPRVFVMCNPSTADASADDPTIRKCIGFAKRHGAGGICVVNLYGYRATNPVALRNTPDPIGPQNAEAVNAAMLLAGSAGAIVAWGMVASDFGPDYRARVADTIRAASSVMTPLMALKIAKDGETPCHPLMLPYAAPLQPWAVP